MRRKQDWITIVIQIVLLGLLIADKMTAQDVVTILRKMELCVSYHQGGPSRTDALSMMMIRSRSAAAVGSCDSNFVSPSCINTRCGIQRATATKARATSDSGRRIASKIPASAAIAASTVDLNSSHSVSFVLSQHLHFDMIPLCVAPLSAIA